MTVTSDGTRTYTWNPDNTLASLGGGVTASFAYDGSGRRVRATVGTQTTQFLNAGDTPIRELDGNGTATADLFTGPDTDQIFARTTLPNGQTSTPLTDALGSTVALTDTTGQVTSQYTYDPYGKPAAGQATDYRYQFTGRDNDATGLQYNRARYYSPEQGRFINEDPAGLAGGDINTYGYASQNPIDGTDPSGLSYFDKACLARQPTTQSEHIPAIRVMAFTDMMSCYVKTDQPLGPWMRFIGPMLIPIPGAAQLGVVVNAARLARLARAAKGAGAARAGKNILEGARYPLHPKIQRQLAKRGWTTDAIDEAVRSGRQVRAVDKATGHPATRYIHPQSGQSVVINDVTGQVIHVGGPGFKYGPGSGDVP